MIKVRLIQTKLKTMYENICDPGPQNQSQGLIILNWDLYIIWKLNT